METLDYLSVLNDKMKEKLIDLCLNRKLIEEFDKEGETLFDEDKMSDETNEEMEIEEDNA